MSTIDALADCWLATRMVPWGCADATDAAQSIRARIRIYLSVMDQRLTPATLAEFARKSDMKGEASADVCGAHDAEQLAAGVGRDLVALKQVGRIDDEAALRIPDYNV